MKKIVALLLLAPLLLASFNLNAQLPVVKTNAGLVSGSEVNGIQIFKGIPFAAAPIGDLRWKAPQPVKPWKEVKACNTFGPSPMQPAPMPFMCWSEEYLIPKEPISEDCLYLNVWTPKKSKQKKAVLVYIYGGGFATGGAGCDIYDGTAMANKDVVFVSINYRVGVFGFLAHPELSNETDKKTSGNYALLDMVAALQWVHDNIENFGGDPGKVTIAGQSAGAFAVNFLAASPLTKGLIHGAIAESGGSILPSTIRPAMHLKQIEEVGLGFAKKLTCNNIQELRNKTANEILAASGMGLVGPFEDGYVVPGSMYETYTKGKQNDIPTIIGWNLDDKIMGMPVSAKQFVENIRKQFGTKADQLLAQYPANDDAEAALSQGDLSRDQTFGVQGYTWASLQSENGKAPVYVYNFNRKLPSATAANDFGAFHTGEVPYAYNNLQKVKNRPFTKADYELADQMSSYWANFAKTGNPNGAGLNQWPVYQKQTKQIMQLDTKLEVVKLPTESKLEVLSKIL
jgi:para-nitrobenzyl esterase